MTESKASIKDLVIYTAIAGKYDFLRSIPKGMIGAEFICFIDTPPYFVKERGWLRLPFPTDIPTETQNAARISRYPKINPHKVLGHKRYSLWVDANIQIISPFADEEILAFMARGVKFAAFKHPLRVCAYAEADICKSLNKDDGKVIDKQIEFLFNHNYPKDNGLIEAGVIFRDHADDVVQRAMDQWSQQLEMFSHRDQIGLNFSAWTAGLRIDHISGNSRGSSRAFVYGPHKGRGVHVIRSYILTYRASSVIVNCIYLGLRFIARSARFMYSITYSKISSLLEAALVK